MTEQSGVAQLILLLEELGLTNVAIAQELGVNAVTVSRWCHGKRGVPDLILRYLELRLKLRNVERDLNEIRMRQLG